MKVIGILNSGSPEILGEQFVAFHRGLGEAGYIDGQNVTTESRWANDDYKRLPGLANDLLDQADVLVAAGGPVSALAAQAATKTKPVVFTTVTDPVKSGLVKSLKRPGGNLTGTAGLTSELDATRLLLLHELKPTANTIGVLVNPHRPGLKDQQTNLQAAADKMKLKLEVMEAGAVGDLKTAFKGFAQRKVEALLVTADPFFNSRRAQVIALAAQHTIPAIYQWRGQAVAGGLMSYGPSIAEAYHHAGIYVGRILKGAEPSALPVVHPTRFELVINLKTAESLGLEIRPELLACSIRPPKGQPKAEFAVVSTHNGG